MKKFNERIGFEKLASADDAKEAFYRGVVKLGADLSDGVNILAEVDTSVGIFKEAIDNDVEPLTYAIELANEATDGEVEKVAMEKFASEDEEDMFEKMAQLSFEIIDKLSEEGEVSRRAAQVLTLYGTIDSDEPLVKISSELGLTEDDVNVAAVALELANEGHSPELLKEAADEAGMEFGKYATYIIQGEKKAMELIKEARLDSEAIEKIAASERIPEPVKIGMASAIEKVASEIHPAGISSLIGEGFQKTAAENGLEADYEAHDLAKLGADIFGYEPEALQSIYSYLSPEYALDKHAAVVSDDYFDVAALAFDTLVKTAALYKKDRLVESESILESASDLAYNLNEDMDKIAERLFVTTSMLGGARPDEIAENIDSAQEWLSEAVAEDEHSKLI